MEGVGVRDGDLCVRRFSRRFSWCARLLVGDRAESVHGQRDTWRGPDRKQSVAHRARVDETHVGIARRCTRHDGGERVGHVDADLGEGQRVLANDLRGELEPVRRPPRLAAREHLEEAETDGAHVDARVDLETHQLLGREIGRGADDGALRRLGAVTSE